METGIQMKYKIGLVLSGGGTRGYAHIGAIKALEEHGIEADILSGTSVGCIVGAMYAYGYRADEMYKILSRYSVLRLSRPLFFGRGFLNFNGLRKQISRYIRAGSFEELKKPLYVAVTNLTRGKVEYIQSGPLQEAVLAAVSIPVMYKPVSIGQDQFADGAVFDNFPISPIRDLCEKVIGINVMPMSGMVAHRGLKMVAFRILQLYTSTLSEASRNQCDILIEPEGIARFGYLGSRHMKKLFNLGYETANKVLAAQIAKPKK